ncbi:alpha-L-rhamnosidase [Paenibacillaceae bacterium]|nr:alpha-L-rhamnosidase [Paenibacillaceae bacterium]
MRDDWQASWIWGDGEASPRNEWRCFRKSFEVPAEGWDGAQLKITADSRYVLHVNGVRLGRGPVRSWPFEQSYDTYEVSHLLKPGEANTIAVMVMHFGVSTFYYIRGRGGLLAELMLLADGKEVDVIPTDDSWLNARHLGQHRRAPRMSCQQGFSEYIDISVWDEQWVNPAYDDKDWQQAVVIGPAGMEPWTKLKPRDIPLLTDETVYPVRVETLHRVKPFTWTTTIDMRNHMLKGSEEHANHVEFSGYVGTIINVPESSPVVLGFPSSGECMAACYVNGERIDHSRYRGTMPEKYVDLTLQAGDNLIVIDVSGQVHTGQLQLGMYCETPYTLRSVLPAEANNFGESGTPFFSIGPFDTNVRIDHQENRELDLNKGPYKEIQTALHSIADLERYKEWLQPIAERFVSEVNVFGLSVGKKESVELSVPAELQNLVIPHDIPAVIPVFEQYDTELIVDFGKEYSGYLSFEVEADEGTIIDFYGYEYMNGEYRQDTFGLDNTIRYVCKQGRQTYLSPIRRGFRYVMITVREAKVPVRFYGLTCVQSNYPVAEIGRFQCSDPLLNDIWQISQHTTKLCMEDTYVDCPAYEQVFWVGDSRNEALVSNYLYGVTDIVKRCLSLVPGSKHQTPLFADQVPSGWSSVIPNWTFFWAIACHEYYLQTADRAFAKEMYEQIKFTLEHYLLKVDESGLLNIKGWNLLDWSPIDQPNNGIVAHQNMFLVKTLRVAAEMAELAEDMEGLRFFSARANEISAAINAQLWEEERNAYIDCIHADGRRSVSCSMQTQVVASLTGVAEGDRKAILSGYLLNPPASFVQIGSPFMSFFYYEALAEAGLVKQIVEDIRHNYGQMIDNGATTCWEMYPNFSENRANPNMLTRSHCHAWSSAPAYFLGKQLLGISGMTPGWEEVTIAPEPCGLSWAKGSVPHPGGGRIDVSWKVDEASGTMGLDVVCPDDVKLTIKLPEGYKGTVREKRLASPTV